MSSTQDEGPIGGSIAGRAMEVRECGVETRIAAGRASCCAEQRDTIAERAATRTDSSSSSRLLRTLATTGSNLDTSNRYSAYTLQGTGKGRHDAKSEVKEPGGLVVFQGAGGVQRRGAKKGCKGGVQRRGAKEGCKGTVQRRGAKVGCKGGV